MLLGLLVSAFACVGTIVIGMDDTMVGAVAPRSRPRASTATPSAPGAATGASGLRWLSLMLVAPIPWAKRVWALPSLTGLAPSGRYYEGKRRAHKKLTDWARPALLQARRWLPTRTLVVVADSSLAVIELLLRRQRLTDPICTARAPAGMVTRSRLDAALYEFAGH